MALFAAADLPPLLAPQDGPCVSIYLPTNRHYPDLQQDHIRFRDLLGRADAALRQLMTPAQAGAFLDRVRQPTLDDVFWTHRTNGLAVLATEAGVKFFDLPRLASEQVVVADSFHVKPLLRLTQSAGRFHVLCLQREHVRLLEGNRDELHEIRPPGIPWTIVEALGEGEGVKRHEQVQKGAAGNVVRPHGDGGSAHAPKSGHAAKGDDAKLDAERYFRAVDKAIRERVGRETDPPLILAALPEHQSMYRGVAHNPRLLARGIEKNPAALSGDQLRGAAWACVEPDYAARLAKLKDDFAVANSRGLGSDDVTAIGPAAHAGRVAVLLIEDNQVIPGRLDSATGAVIRGELTEAGNDDILDELAGRVLRAKGTVVVVPAAQMPTANGAAATFRY